MTKARQEFQLEHYMYSYAADVLDEGGELAMSGPEIKFAMVILL
jgi:hypothetical protein